MYLHPYPRSVISTHDIFRATNLYQTNRSMSLVERLPRGYKPKHIFQTIQRYDNFRGKLETFKRSGVIRDLKEFANACLPFLFLRYFRLFIEFENRKVASLKEVVWVMVAIWNKNGLATETSADIFDRRWMNLTIYKFWWHKNISNNISSNSSLTQ